MERRRFLKSAAIVSVGCVLPPQIGVAAENGLGEHAGFLNRFFRENLIIDGVVQPSPKGQRWLTKKGEIKAQTGINAAAMSCAESSLARTRDYLARSTGSFVHVKKGTDLELAFRTGRYGLIMYFQSAKNNLDNDIRKLGRWRDLGLRIYQFTYQENNELGGGGADDNQPLTALGHGVLKECEQTGMLVDVSHCGKRTTLDILEKSSQPVTANHVNAERLTPIQRNKSDEELKAVAATGGLVAPMIIGSFLRSPRQRRGGIDQLVQHLEYMVDLIGIDHVGIASDTYIDGQNVSERHDADSYLNSYGRWKYVAAKLLDKGYREGDLKKIFGANFHRVYRKTLV